MTAGDLEERPAYKIELEEDGGCWNPVGQCFSFVRGGWILIRRGFLSISPPHTHTRIYTFTHAHTHTKQVVCPVEAQAPCHLDLLGSAETPPISRKERERRISL